MQSKQTGAGKAVRSSPSTHRAGEGCRHTANVATAAAAVTATITVTIATTIVTAATTTITVTTAYNTRDHS